MDQCNPDAITLFYKRLSVPQPIIKGVTSLIAEITTRDGKKRADLDEYIDYCKVAILRTFQMEEECKNKRQFLPANDDGDIAEEILSSKRKQNDSEEALAVAMREIFENRIALVQRILAGRNFPAQRISKHRMAVAMNYSAFKDEEVAGLNPSGQFVCTETLPLLHEETAGINPSTNKQFGNSNTAWTNAGPN